MGAADEVRENCRLSAERYAERSHENLYSTTLHLYQRISMICELLSPSSILAVKLNRNPFVTVLEIHNQQHDSAARYRYECKPRRCVVIISPEN